MFPEFEWNIYANDVTAIGALRSLKEEGVKVPGEISIISVDDIETSRYISPMLTAVYIPVQEMGQMAAKVLIDRIEGGYKLPMKVLLPISVAHRESSAAVKSAFSDQDR